MADLGDFPIYFYLVPLLLFGVLYILMLRSFGVRNLFTFSKDGEKVKAGGKKDRHRDVIAKEAASRFGLRKISPSGWALQGGLYLLFLVVVGVLSDTPGYTFLEPEKAVIRLSLSHPGERKQECRRRSREELAKLPPNMRAPRQCPRERWPVRVVLELDGRELYSGAANPAGLANDGASSFYRNFKVPAGRHRIVLRLNDSGDKKPDKMIDKEIDISPTRILVAGFDPRADAMFLK